MLQCRDACRKLFRIPTELIDHSEKECKELAAVQANKDTKLFSDILEELEKVHRGTSCVACGRSYDEKHTTRCVLGKAEKRAERTSYIRRSADTRLLRELKKLFIGLKNKSEYCRSCGELRGRLGVLHVPGCISVRIQSRIARFQ